VLVVIDQAEELLTRTGTDEQQAFLDLLGGALHKHSPIWAVATVRSEFLSTAPDRAGLAELIDDPLVIEPLSRNRLAEVIARPAQRAGLAFAPGLIERMVEETKGGDALPLLAHTLYEMGSKRCRGREDAHPVQGLRDAGRGRGRTAASRRSTTQGALRAGAQPGHPAHTSEARDTRSGR
jgi:hypothetical protein